MSFLAALIGETSTGSAVNELPARLGTLPERAHLPWSRPGPFPAHRRQTWDGRSCRETIAGALISPIGCADLLAAASLQISTPAPVLR
jgi:hypothetical protein